jgi:hypothetical protein
MAGKTITSRLIDPSASYAAALMNNTQQRHPGHPTHPKDTSQYQHQAAQLTAQAPRKETKTLDTPKRKDTEVLNAPLSSGQSVQANSVNNSLNDMFKIAAIVQQIMIELNSAATEEQKIVVITKIVCNLMKENGH